jgi:hypothetical protein
MLKTNDINYVTHEPETKIGNFFTKLALTIIFFYNLSKLSKFIGFSQANKTNTNLILSQP